MMDKETMSSAARLAGLLRIRLAGPTHVGTDGRMPRIAESHTTISRQTLGEVIDVLEAIAAADAAPAVEGKRVDTTAPWDLDPTFVPKFIEAPKASV